MIISLVRTTTSDEGSFGELFDEDGEFVCFTGELPWRDNRRMVSCIPEGEYALQRWNSAKFPNTLHVMDVPSRSAILIHSANYCGDTTKGYKTHLNGCIAPGRLLGRLGGQNAILASKPALRKVVAMVPTKLMVEERF